MRGNESKAIHVRWGKARPAFVLTLGLTFAVLLWALRSEPLLSQAANTITLNNQFVSATMDTTFTAGSGTTAATGNGDIGFSTTGGDPLNPNDNNRQLVINQANGVANVGTGTTLRILDDFQGRPITNSFRDMQVRGGGTGVDGPAPAGGTGGTTIASTEVFSLVNQPGVTNNSLVANFQTLPTATGVTGLGWLVRRTVTLVRNQFQIQYDITNRDAAFRRAGLRILLDTAGSVLGIDDTYFIPGFGVITTEREFNSLTGIPESFFVTNDINAPTVLAQGILRGSAATTPDRFLIINGPLLGGSLFDYTVGTNNSILPDARYAVYWNPQTYGPGETKTFITYYGLGFASGEYRAPFVLATRAPTKLNSFPGPDPVNPGPNQLAHFQPSQFNIIGSVFNLSTLPFSNVTLNLSVPPGLQLAPGETSAKAIASAGPLQDASVSWQVQASATGAGSLSYSVSASVPLVGSKSVARSIGVPALPQDMPLGTDVQMVSFPYTFPNTSPDQILFSELTNRLIPSAELKLATFDPRAGEYLRFPTDVTALVPGTGYWMMSLQGAINLRLGDAVNNPPRAVSTSGPFPIQLRAGSGPFGGWNMVGNPFLLPVSLGQLEVVARGQRLSFSDAGLQQLIRPILFNFQRGRGNISADYFAVSNPADELVPRLGYWIRALDDVQLIVNPPQIINQAQSRVLRPSLLNDAYENEWRLRLAASAGEGGDFATAGVSTRGSDSFDALDTEKPPTFSEAVRVHFNHVDWGRNSGRFALDIRQPFVGRKTWDADVETNLHAEGVVTVTWPTLDRLSRNLRFVLTDLTTNRIVMMRLEHGYPFKAPAGPSVRHLRITVETGGASGSLRLQVQAIATQGGNLVVPFTATEAGVVNCAVLSPSGKTVSVVCNDAPMTAGLNSVRWSRKNQQGLSLPRGVYIIRLTAKSDSGGQAQVVKSIQIK